MDRIFTVAIIGCGSRGAEAYGREMFEQKDKWKIVSVCDTNPVKTAKYGAIFAVSEENRFCDEFEFFKKKRADALIIATMDNDHVRQCKRALELGYDVLLEKPITANEEECRSLLEAHRRYGKKVMVCHVLRYAPAFVKLKELLEKKVCGEPVMIDSIEQVCYWHQAHSFVRGNWRNGDETSPMILQKCCHDLDLLQYYAESRCESISSIGDLRFFKAENKPEGAADRCEDCKLWKDCTYSAQNIYIGNWKSIGSPENCWPYNAITTAVPQTEENLTEAIKTGPYGRCVFACDNNVVDNQIVMAHFRNGVNANLRMTAFTAGGGRIMKFYCTQGEIDFEDALNRIAVRRFNRPEEIIDVNTLHFEGGHNHGGGDGGLIHAFYECLCGEESAPTGLEASVESHLMAFAAEKSRLHGGEPYKIHKDESERR